MKNKKINTDNKDVKNINPSTPIIIPDRFYYLCFSECSEKHLPTSKEDFKEIVKTLKSFNNYQRSKHPLKGEYKKEKIHSIDVQKRGNYRMLYKPHENRSDIYKILKLFTDETHK